MHPLGREGGPSLREEDFLLLPALWLPSQGWSSQVPALLELFSSPAFLISGLP